MLTHRCQKRVRYGETDQMGYLYYGNYAVYYEIGRVEMLRSVGLTYRSLETEHGVWMPVMRLDIRYVRPALYDDLITIQTSLRTLPARTITFDMELFNERNKLINGGKVSLCFVDANTQKRIDCPTLLLDALRPSFS